MRLAGDGRGEAERQEKRKIQGKMESKGRVEKGLVLSEVRKNEAGRVNCWEWCEQKCPGRGDAESGGRGGRFPGGEGVKPRMKNRRMQRHSRNAMPWGHLKQYGIGSEWGGGGRGVWEVEVKRQKATTPGEVS